MAVSEPGAFSKGVHHPLHDPRSAESADQVSHKTSCAHCPFGKKVADKQLTVISWDRMLEEAYEAEADNNENGSPTQEMGDFNLLLDDLQQVMDKEDARLMKTLKMKKLMGYSVQEIAAELNCSQPRVYQLLDRAKELAREYLADND